MTAATPDATNTAPPAYTPPMNAGGLPLPDANAPAKPRKIEPLRPGTYPLHARSHSVQDFAATVPADTQREDLLTGEFWVNYASRLQLHSEIRILWEDGSKYARLLVTHVAGRFSRLKCLEWHNLDEVVTMADEVHTIDVKHRGVHKWCLVDTTDGKILKSMIATQVDALKERQDLYAARGR